MGSAFHQLCPRYSGTLTSTAPTAIRLWDTFTLYIYINLHYKSVSVSDPVYSKVLLLRNYISLTPNIYLISLVFSESGKRNRCDA